MGALTTLLPASNSVLVKDVFDSGDVYRLEVHAPAGSASQRWLTVIDAADSPAAVPTPTRYSPGDGNVLSGGFFGVALNGGATNWLALFNGADTDPAPAQPFIYTILPKDTSHVISGLAPGVGFAITTSVSGSNLNVQIAPGGGFLSSAGGVLYFRTGQDGVVTGALTARPANLVLRPNLGNPQFNFYLTGSAGVPYLLQSSTNLLDWFPLATNVLADGIVFFSYPIPPGPGQQFYRALAHR